MASTELPHKSLLNALKLLHLLLFLHGTYRNLQIHTIAIIFSVVFRSPLTIQSHEGKDCVSFIHCGIPRVWRYSRCPITFLKCMLNTSKNSLA